MWPGTESLFKVFLSSDSEIWRLWLKKKFELCTKLFILFQIFGWNSSIQKITIAKILKEQKDHFKLADRRERARLPWASPDRFQVRALRRRPFGCSRRSCCPFVVQSVVRSWDVRRWIVRDSCRSTRRPERRCPAERRCRRRTAWPRSWLWRLKLKEKEISLHFKNVYKFKIILQFVCFGFFSKSIVECPHNRK